MQVEKDILYLLDKEGIHLNLKTHGYFHYSDL